MSKRAVKKKALMKKRMAEVTVKPVKSNRVRSTGNGRNAILDIEKKHFSGRADVEVLDKWLRKNYTKILRLQELKPRMWEGYSHEFKGLKEQLYYDRMNVRQAAKYSKYSMKQLLQQFERTELFISKDELYAENMLKGMERHFNNDFQKLTDMLGANPHNVNSYYDQTRDQFVFEGSKRTIAITVDHGISPKEGIGSGANYLYEVL